MHEVLEEPRFTSLRRHALRLLLLSSLRVPQVALRGLDVGGFQAEVQALSDEWLGGPVGRSARLATFAVASAKAFHCKPCIIFFKGLKD